MSELDVAPPLRTCAEVVRTLRATGASAPPLLEKLRVARRLARADDEACLFPHARRFALEWLCSALRGARPRAEPDCWRLLGELLGIDDTALRGQFGAAGGLADDPLPAGLADPRFRVAPPSPEVAAQLSQSTRLVLLAAGTALAAAAAGLATARDVDGPSNLAASGEAADSARAEALAVSLQLVMRRLLRELPSAFPSEQGTLLLWRSEFITVLNLPKANLPIRANNNPECAALAQNTICYLYVCCFVNTIPLNMYVLMS